MEKTSASIDLKALNRNKIYRHLWKSKRASKQSLMKALDLSLPTVTQNLIEMMAQGLICENGSFNATGGRSAKGFSICPTARLAIGVDVNRTHVAVVAVDLYGNILESIHEHRRFENTDRYYRGVAELTCSLAEQAGISHENLLGVGIAVQGLVSRDRKTLTYGEVLGITNEHVDRIAAHIPYSCELFHDSAAAAFAECWVSPHLQNAVYLSLSTNLGGALIIGRQILGADGIQSGNVEHMTLVPDGGKCYCGQRGCAEVYCSASALTEGVGDEKLATFFALLEQGDTTATARWDVYLEHLAMLANNVHILIGSDVILGGYMSAYLLPYLDALKARAYARHSLNRAPNYIRAALFQKEAIAAGAALHYVDAFLSAV